MLYIHISKAYIDENALFFIYMNTNPSERAGGDTKSIFEWSLIGLNSELSFSLTSCQTTIKEHSLSWT